MMITYGFTKELSISLDQAIALTTEQLKQEGFGILMQLNLHEKIKEKLGIDFQHYVILGACHPPSAYKAIVAEEHIGLLLPCNVLLYEKGAKTVLAIIKPTVAMSIVANEDLRALAEEIESKLQRVFDRIV